MVRKGANSTYWGNIGEAFTTLMEGLKLTLNHILQSRRRWYPFGIKDNDYFKSDTGTFTVRYPHETLPVPDTGRYQLHNEIEDCIVCDKCAKICPVDCIEIEPVKSVGEYGKTSDGTPKRIYAARFDIDMAKCCFCGLCTTVCPTECLTMTPHYDFSEYDVKKHVFSFSKMTPEDITAKKQEWENFEKEQKQKQELSLQPGIQPPVKPVIKTQVNKEEPSDRIQNPPGISGDIRKKMKPVIKPKEQDQNPGDN